MDCSDCISPGSGTFSNRVFAFSDASASHGQSEKLILPSAIRPPFSSWITHKLCHTARKGRFDELFFVDLPNQAEREAIWEIQIGNYGRDPKDFDVVQLSRATDGLTGSEIEQVFVDALFLAFDSDREPTDLDIAGVLTESVPLSKLMAEQISGLRNWAKGRARTATSSSVSGGLRKLVV